MAKVTQAHLDARRKQILDAAFACFGRRGFHQTTTQEICREAELSPGAIYSYFRSKEEIIEAMADETCRRNAVLAESVRAGGGLRQAVDVLAAVAFHPLRDPQVCEAQCLDLEIWAEALRNPRVGAALGRIFAGLRDAITTVVREAQDRREIDPALDPAAVAMVVISLCEGLVLQKGIDRAADVEGYVEVVKAMMLGAFWQGGPESEGTP